MKVTEIMTSDVVGVQETSGIEEAARLLSRHRISGLPVFGSSGALVGLVTEYDLISKTGKQVGDIMSRSIISVSPETDVDEVKHLLTNSRIRRVPVLDGDKLVGIVSRSDLIKQIAMHWVCHTCGEVVRSASTPERCPACGGKSEAFSQQIEPPGM